MGVVDGGKREQFVRDGFVVFRGVLEPELVGDLRAWSDGVLGAQEAAHFEQNRTTGSMVLIDWAMAYRYSVLGELIAHPRVLAALGALGFVGAEVRARADNQQAATESAAVLARGRAVLG